MKVALYLIICCAFIGSTGVRGSDLYLPIKLAGSGGAAGNGFTRFVGSLRAQTRNLVHRPAQKFAQTFKRRQAETGAQRTPPSPMPTSATAGAQRVPPLVTVTEGSAPAEAGHATVTARQTWMWWLAHVFAQLLFAALFFCVTGLELLKRWVAPRLLRARRIDCARLTIRFELRAASLSIALMDVSFPEEAVDYLKLINDCILGGYLPTSLRSMRADEFVLSFRVGILLRRIAQVPGFWALFLKKKATPSQPSQAQPSPAQPGPV